MTSRLVGGVIGIWIAGLPVLGAEPFELRSGDRVVLVGNTFMERAQRFGHLETMWSIAAGSRVRGVTFRNLGWSGDSVFADSRSYFGEPKEGRDRLAKVIAELKPTVLVSCYGTGAAMSADTGWTNDPEGAARSRSGDAESRELFIEAYADLLDLLEQSAGESLREVILLAPPPLETLGAPLPDQHSNNRRLALYRDALRDLSANRDCRLVDLFAALGGDEQVEGRVQAGPLTANGVHYGDAGYRLIASEFVRGLGLHVPEGLSANDPSLEKMRAATVAKNRLFFHRWRPVNETYLFLFRAHEQGQNAKEIPMFDPLIKDAEKEIDGLRETVFHKLENGR